MGFSTFSYRNVIGYQCHFLYSCLIINYSSSMGQNDRFLFKKNLFKHDAFGSSERLPPFSGVLPTNKNTYPPVRKPPPIHPDVCFLLAAFAIPFFLQGLDQDCIASGFLIHLRQMFLVQFFTFQDAKTHQKKGILKMIDF